MKKLMIATLGLAAVGSVFGNPLVYDFKATVKHINLKEVNVNVKANGSTTKYKVYQKFMTSAALKGYLIQDEDGLTSQCLNNSTATTYDAGRNRGFLVVQNSKAKPASVKKPKILPAILDAKWLDTAFNKNHTAKSGLAEGTLFIGGDMVGTVRPKLEKVGGTISELHEDSRCAGYATVTSDPSAAKPGTVALADYAWTSIYLFGQFNGPNWFTRQDVCPFEKFELAWDDNLPATVARGLATAWQDPLNPTLPVNYFHDTWMNGAGIGKWVKEADTTSGELCCGLKKQTTIGGKVLQSLTGNLKGGLFLCTENGIDAESYNYNWFDDVAWEDQFNCERVDPALTFAGDAWQNDLWQDGTIEQETTDVLYGNWSIKLNTKFYAAKGGVAKELDVAEMNKVLGLPVETTGTTKSALKAYAVLGAIKGAALKLNSKANWFDGSEIYAKESAERFDLPVVTPAFAKHYGLDAQ